ncbi:hypothetical protein CCACVL1_23868 [Corchorus capsularis]|uniref:RING-type E3 ubiquitin transferase n=1 Tax=Corchorus capsularis TaxID=210143 RepID=A0A1R3GRX2_COCAP|nr:hypothetical protein CCACVL1_23868 [Corchorus capsularis]
MKNLSPLFCLLIFILIINVNNGQTCSSSCGNIPIRYPFRLSKDPASCGDRDYELSCLENNSTILYFRKGFYYVKKISYDKHIIQVVDVNFANGSCGLPSRALSMDDLLNDPRYPGWSNYHYAYTLYYLRCSSEISDLANSKVPCLSDDLSNVYVKVTSYWRRFFTFIDFPNSCKLISTLPSYYYGIKNVEQKKPSYETILKMQESGFDMVWSVECRDCKSKSRSCHQRLANSTTEFDCYTISYDDDYDEYVQAIVDLTVVTVEGIFFISFVSNIHTPPLGYICFPLPQMLLFKRSLRRFIFGLWCHRIARFGNVTRPKLMIWKCLPKPESDSPKEMLVPEFMDQRSLLYPFRLSKDPAGCGDRDYELSCLENNSTILYFRKGFYYVKKISYDEHIIRVVDVNFVNGSCGLPNRDLTLDQLYNDPLYPGMTKNVTYTYTLNYLRCSNEISDLGKTRVPCLSGDVYVNLTSYYDSPSFLEIPSSCKLISAVPAYYEDEMLEQKKISYETILKMQESGFDMVWSVGCRECMSRRRRSMCSQRFPSTTEFECIQLYDDEYYDEIRQIIIAFSVVSLEVCGDKDYELSCQNNNDTILNFRKGSYYVKRIYYEDHVIQVVDVNLANGSCGLPSRALSMDDLLNDPRYPGWTNYDYAYTLNYLRCSTEISDLANSRVPCLSDDSSNVYVMVTSYWRSPFILEIPKSCKLISALPSYYYDIEMVEQKNPSYETILKMQESGFDMVWSVECRDCNSKRRSCIQGFNSTTEFACLTKVDNNDFYDKFGGIYTSVSVAFVADSYSFHWLYLLSFATNAAIQEIKKIHIWF